MGPGCQPDPPVSDSEAGDTAATAQKTAQHIGGEVSGETRATVVLTTTRRTRWCLEYGLYRPQPIVTICTADGGEAAVELQRRQAMAGSTELGTSFRRTLPCYTSQEKGTGRFLATPAMAARRRGTVVCRPASATAGPGEWSYGTTVLRRHYSC